MVRPAPSALLMLERAITEKTDREILDQCRTEMRQLLEEAELRLWEFEDDGWTAPEDDDTITYAMRLLLFADVGRLGWLANLAREIAILRPETNGA